MSRMLVKICGATTVDEVHAVATAGADLVGLWHGVAGGRAELGVAQLCLLAATAHHIRQVRPVLVTLATEADAVWQVAALAGIRWVQLHGFQQPGMVRALKVTCPELTVVKVVHLDQLRCVEAPLIGAYERAGVDVFLLDSLGSGGELGSTGQPLDAGVAAGLADRTRRPIMIAGGLTAGNAAHYRDITGHPRFLGIDVDSASRGADGRITTDLVGAIRRAWTGSEAA